MSFFLIVNAIVTFDLFWKVSKSNAIRGAVHFEIQEQRKSQSSWSIILFFHTPASTEQSTIREITASDAFEWLWKLTNFEIAIFLLILAIGIIWLTCEITKRCQKVRYDRLRYISGLNLKNRNGFNWATRWSTTNSRSQKKFRMSTSRSIWISDKMRRAF